MLEREDGETTETLDDAQHLRFPSGINDEHPLRTGLDVCAIPGKDVLRVAVLQPQLSYYELDQMVISFVYGLSQEEGGRGYGAFVDSPVIPPRQSESSEGIRIGPIVRGLRRDDECGVGMFLLRELLDWLDRAKSLGIGIDAHGRPPVFLGTINWLNRAKSLGVGGTFDADADAGVGLIDTDAADADGHPLVFRDEEISAEAIVLTTHKLALLLTILIIAFYGDGDSSKKWWEALQQECVHRGPGFLADIILSFPRMFLRGRAREAFLIDVLVRLLSLHDARARPRAPRRPNLAHVGDRFCFFPGEKDVVFGVMLGIVAGRNQIRCGGQDGTRSDFVLSFAKDFFWRWVDTRASWDAILHLVLVCAPEMVRRRVLFWEPHETITSVP